MTKPEQFDLGRKNYLSYREYVGFCNSILKQPMKKSEIGDKIKFENIKFKKYDSDLSPVFQFFANNKDMITFETLKNAVERLRVDISDSEIYEMLHYFDVDGVVDLDKFLNIFNTEQ